MADKLTVWEFMEDFDNDEFNDYDWQEQLEDAVRTYNELYGASYDPLKTFKSYKVRFRRRL